MDRPRVVPARTGTDPVGPPIADDLDVSREIGAVDGDRAIGGQGGQRLGSRVTVLVVMAGGDHRHGWPGGVEQARRRGRMGAVMPDFEHVDRPQDAAADERFLDRRLGVAGQQCRESAVPQEEHDRSVVDVTLR